MSSASERDKTSVVIAFSSVAKRNPYQSKLIEGLIKQGVSIAPSGSLAHLLKSRLTGQNWPRIFHVQWLPHLRSGLRGRIRAWRFLFLLRIRELLGQKMVWTVHNLRSHESVHPEIEDQMGYDLAKISKAVIVHSPLAIPLIQEQFQVRDTSKIVVIPHGNYIGAHSDFVTREEARNEMQFTEGQFVVAFVGNIRNYKGVVPLIRAFREIENSDCRLLVAGNPISESLAGEIREAKGGDERITLDLKWLSDREVEVSLKACDVAVFPYTQILTSGAVVLAMSYGRACIVPDLGCLPDLISEKGGFVYDPTMVGSLASSIKDAVENRSFLDAMGESNLEDAQKWSWDSVAEMTRMLYVDVLSGRPVSKS